MRNDGISIRQGRRDLLLLLFFLFVLPSIRIGLGFPALSAQPSTSANLIGVGPTRLLDTYLTPEHFSGTGITYLNIREWQRPGRHWATTLQQEVDLSFSHDRSRITDDLEGAYSLYWGRYRTWQLLDDRLRLQAGGVLNATLGFIYDTMSSNNPAQARAAVNLMPSAVATYGFELFQQQFSARYEIDLPLLGLMFSPNYGQSYYEIFTQGNYDHNLVPTTPFSAPNLRHLLFLDWQVSTKWTLRAGYLGNYQQAQVNNLKQRVFTHRVMVGVVRHL